MERSIKFKQKAAVILVVLIISGASIYTYFQHFSTEEITMEELERLTISYFLENYDKEVKVNDISRFRILEDLRIYTAQVSDGETTHTLYFDKKNQPAFDTVEADNMLAPYWSGELSLETDLVTTVDFKIDYSMGRSGQSEDLKEWNYKTSCTITLYESPDMSWLDSFHSIKTEVIDKGFDSFRISVVFPRFTPNEIIPSGKNHGGASGNKNVDEQEFRDRYELLCSQVYWDAAEIQKSLRYLEEKGFHNITIYDGTTSFDPVVLTVQYNSFGEDLDLQSAEEYLMDMTENYIKLQDHEITFSFYDQNDKQ